MMSWPWAIPERPPGHVRAVRRSLAVRRGLLANPSRAATIYPVSNNVTPYNTSVTGIASVAITMAARSGPLPKVVPAQPSSWWS